MTNTPLTPTADGLALVTYMTALNADGTFAANTGSGTTASTFWSYYSNPDAVTARSWGSGTTIYYAFDANSNWSAAEKNAYIQGMTLWSAVANINFAPATASNAATLRFIRGTTETASESDNLDTDPVNGTNNVPAAVTSASITIGTVAGASWQFISSYADNGANGPSTVLHELFHALGMGHPGPYNYNGNLPASDPANSTYQRYVTDSAKYTIMSYITPTTTAANVGSGGQLLSGMNDPNSINYVNWNYTDSGDNAVTGNLVTFGLYDVLAAQRVYGASTSSTLSGGQTFGFNSNVTYQTFDGSTARLGAYDFTVNTNPVVTLYDRGANNTLDLSGFTADASETIDLRPGAFSSAAGLVNNLSIAFGTSINTAKGGGGHSTFITNASNDTIVGGNDATVANTDNTVVLSGTFASYTLSKDNQGVVTAVIAGTTDTMTNIQTLRFDDMSVATSTIACFAQGTRLATERGEIAVENLVIGDRLVLAAGGLRPVVWIGHRSIACARHPQPAEIWPIRVAAHAFGQGQPRRDLYLSPDHAVFAENILVPIRDLQNGCSISGVAQSHVSYWHVELDAHDIILAEGMPVESFLENGNRADFEGGETLHLHPRFTGSAGAAPCAPLLRQGPLVERIRSGLAGRAADQAGARNSSKYSVAITRRSVSCDSKA